MSTTTNVSDYSAITTAVRHYLDGAVSGRGDDMKPGFHKDATIFGFVGSDFFAGPIQKLFEWNDTNGPAKGLKAHIASIDLVGSAASVRVETDEWTGHRFTDFFNLLKIDGHWKIMNKIFHMHS